MDGFYPSRDRLRQMLDTDPRLERLKNRRGTVSGAPDIAREVVGLVISMTDHASETAYPTLDDLAAWTRHSRRSIIRALKWGEDAGYITRVPGWEGVATRYRPRSETARNFVLGKRTPDFWQAFFGGEIFPPENSGSATQMAHPSATQMAHPHATQVAPESVRDGENSENFSPPPPAPASAAGAAPASASAGFDFNRLMSLLWKYGRHREVKAKPESIRKRYEVALTYPGVTDEILCTRYEAHLVSRIGKTFTFPSLWLRDPDNYTGPENSKPGAINETDHNGLADSSGPEASTGEADDAPVSPEQTAHREENARKFVLRKTGWTTAQAIEFMGVNEIDRDANDRWQSMARIVTENVAVAAE